MLTYTRDDIEWKPSSSPSAASPSPSPPLVVLLLLWEMPIKLLLKLHIAFALIKYGHAKDTATSHPYVPITGSCCYTLLCVSTNWPIHSSVQVQHKASEQLCNRIGRGLIDMANKLFSCNQRIERRRSGKPF